VRRAVPLGLALLAGGCVYYNGMYNTERLAGSARRAEREGRPFEANNLWGQVITRADSLVLRHPRSKYADQAQVFKGLALSRLGQCPEAILPLARAPGLDLDRDIAEEASLALGRCRLELGDPAAAALAFGRVSESADPTRRREARVHLAQAHRLTGSGEAALAALEGVDHPRAGRERLLSLAAARRADEALAVAESLLAVSDSAPIWDSIITEVGRSNPGVASALVDRLGRQPSVAPVQHARRLLDDADRLASVDSARAVDRLRTAARVGVNTEGGDEAELRLLRLEASRAVTPADLARIADTLRRLAPRRGVAVQESYLLAATVARLQGAADSGGPGTPQGDLRLFLAAEAARDTLRAPALAAGLFRRVVEEWPDSPYAPKAALAGRMLDPAWGAAVESLLVGRYASSPYIAFVRGEARAEYRELEDSLQTFALTRAGAGRRAPAAGGRRREDFIQPDSTRPQGSPPSRRGVVQ
jgi:tetratricopeptide (TPR) repeat protein